MANDLDELCAPWATLDDVCCAIAPAEGGFDPYVMQDMLAFASWDLYQLTGSQWPGECTDTVRPCAKAVATSNSPVWHGAPLSSAWGGGWGWWQWFASWGVCGCPGLDGCGCHGPRRIQLGGYPITGITEVKVDGVVLDPAEYQIVDLEWLERCPNVGETTPRHWPCCQRIDLPDTEDHTFSVTFTFGEPPPRAGVLAAASLACDLAAACDPNGSCAVPERVARRLYENSEYEFRTVDDRETNDDGFTGNRLADLFIAAANPGKIRSPATVWSPDFGNRVHRIT